MKIKLKIIWICFYMFALLILCLNGHVKMRHVRNFWKEFLETIKKPTKSDEDGDYVLVHKNDKK